MDLFCRPIVHSRRRDITAQSGLFPWFDSQRRRSDEALSIAESPTSRAAARRIGQHAGTVAHRVVNAIRAAGQYGKTDHELAADLHLLGDTVRSRRVRLRDEGAVVDSGRRRPSPRGCASVVWVIATEA
jgi:hypothetical protein